MPVHTSESLLHTALLSHSANQSGTLAVEFMGVTWKEPCVALELESRWLEERIPGVTATGRMVKRVADESRFPVSTSCPIRLLTTPRDMLVELHSRAFPSTGPTSNLNLNINPGRVSRQQEVTFSSQGSEVGNPQIKDF